MWYGQWSEHAATDNDRSMDTTDKARVEITMVATVAVVRQIDSQKLVPVSDLHVRFGISHYVMDST